MILNVSGRTDIVAFYTTWFLKRMKEGFVDVRNPFYPKKISRIYFKDVDLIVFCTKNPIPILPYLEEIKIPILFQITLTPYKKDIEPNVPSKEKVVKAIQEIAKKIGKENVFVRYDPILLNNTYNLEYHEKAFQRLCEILEGFTETIIISFIDPYKNVLCNAQELNLKNITLEEVQKMAAFLGPTAKKYGMKVQTCFEKMDLSKYGIANTPCVPRGLAFEKTGKKFKLWNARKCGCVEMVDIGAYNTCPHLCKYCYANYKENEVLKNKQQHNPNSSLLIGEIASNDEIKFRQP